MRWMLSFLQSFYGVSLTSFEFRAANEEIGEKQIGEQHLLVVLVVAPTRRSCFAMASIAKPNIFHIYVFNT